MRCLRFALLIAVATTGAGDVTLVLASARAHGSALPVQGAALEDTGLHLIVAGSPSFRVDVDARRVARIDVPAAPGRTPSTVQRTGRAAVVIAGPCASCGRNQRAFLVRPGASRALPLGHAWNSAPAARGAWLMRFEGAGRCSLRLVSPTGAARPSHASRWASSLEGQSPPGLIVNRSLLEDPASGRVLLRAPGMLAAAGARVLRSPARGSLLLERLGDRRRRRLRWPSRYGYVHDARVSDSQARIAVWFEDGPVDQHIDVWTLDPADGRFQHVPGFPIAAEIKQTSLAWTPDGRLAILTRTRGRDALIVWRPSAPRAASGFLDLPPRSGSNALAAW
jgi:hypothetical protein